MMVESREYYLRLTLLAVGLVLAYLSVTQNLANPDVLASQATGRSLETSLAMFIVPINTALAIHDRIAGGVSLPVRVVSIEYDRLTGLFTRSSCFDQFDQWRFDLEPERDYFFLVLGIEELEGADDQHSRISRDAVMVHAANSLRGLVEPEMLLGRLSECELIICGSGASIASVREFGQAVVGYVESDERYYGGKTIQVSACIGVCRAGNTQPIGAIINRASAMMGELTPTGADKMILYR